jgi:hypothetical protein
LALPGAAHPEERLFSANNTPILKRVEPLVSNRNV